MQGDEGKHEALQVLDQVVKAPKAFGVLRVLHVVHRLNLGAGERNVLCIGDAIQRETRNARSRCEGKIVWLITTDLPYCVLLLHERQNEPSLQKAPKSNSGNVWKQAVSFRKIHAMLTVADFYLEILLALSIWRRPLSSKKTKPRNEMREKSRHGPRIRPYTQIDNDRWSAK